MKRVLAALFMAGVASGCSTAPHCTPPAKAMTRDVLYLGATTPDGLVADADWSRFLEVVVTPLFPQGFTVVDARGQWRDASGTIGHEPARLLDIVHPADDASDHAITDLAAAYQRRFRQESVLRVTTPVCAAF